MFLANNVLNRISSYLYAKNVLCSRLLPHIKDAETQREVCRCARAFVRSGWSVAAAMEGYVANDLFAAPLDPEVDRGLLWAAGTARVVGVDAAGLTLNDGRRLLRPGYTPPIPFTGPNAWEQMREKIERKKRAATRKPARVGAGALA